jgi:formylglycine-generating enzyme required for sulfatase activity
MTYAATALEQSKAKVFISYSRKDSTAFADELVLGPEDRGFAPFIDRHDIEPGEPWEARLGGLIEQSDTVVFVISPESVKSERCVWEVEKALALSKRLLPVIYKSVPDGQIPAKLSSLQFVRFDTAPGMMRPLRELAQALRVDLEWIREHTRLGELAVRWQSRNRPESLLLRGDDLDVATAWAAKRRQEAPEITDLQRVFLRASEQAEIARRSRTRRTQKFIGALAAVIVLLILGIGAGLAWSSRVYLHALAVTLKETIWPQVLTAEAERALKPGQDFKECAPCPVMIVVASGEFVMGSPKNENGHQSTEEPQHKILIKQPFAVSRFETTFDEWDVCAALRGCTNLPSDRGWGRGRRPVINVSWDDVQQYVAWLSKRTGKPYRLLSEAEWEYAARAGTTTAYPWGDKIGKNNANCADCGSPWDLKQTAPVGTFLANAFGLHDMHGNVFEWTDDCFHDNYRGAPEDATAWTADGNCKGRVARGGSWEYVSGRLRSANRDWYSTGSPNSGLGFRVGRTLAP